MSQHHGRKLELAKVLTSSGYPVAAIEISFGSDDAYLYRLGSGEVPRAELRNRDHPNLAPQLQIRPSRTVHPLTLSKFFLSSTPNVVRLALVLPYNTRRPPSSSLF
jgi:hypothetical protein